MKATRRMMRLSRFRPKVSRINLTSLMDVFTILVFFLVMNAGPTQVLDAVRVLGNGRPRTVLAACVEVKRLEEEGDALYHTWLGRLFDETNDPVRLMKWKEIYDSLERTLDVAEDVANVLESVAIKHG